MSQGLRPKSLKLAPEANSVFSRPDFHSKYFLPLLSLELSDVFDDLEGLVHFVDPLEPYDGLIGERTTESHNYYCRMNWISFKIENGLYEFEAPESYFEKIYLNSHPVPQRVHESVRDGWHEAVIEHYRKRSAKYASWRKELPIDMDQAIDNHGIWLENFTEGPYDLNWTCLSDFPLDVFKSHVPATDSLMTFCYPLTEDGRRFRYVGFMESFDRR